MLIKAIKNNLEITPELLQESDVNYEEPLLHTCALWGALLNNYSIK